jgi:iron complex outermembrane receptor protein
MKTRMKCLLTLLIFSSVSVVNSQCTLKGKVTDLDGTPLFGVSISLKNSFLQTETDGSGSFALVNVTDMSWEIKCEKAGYETRIFTLTQNDANQPCNQLLEVKLEKAVRTIEEVQVSAVRAGNKSPTSYTNLTKEELNERNYGQDLPYLLEQTPSAVVTSDAGTGIGYTGVRIRGVDPTRTNVTINGIPINDAESHAVYWVNMPDFASSTESVQVQRGVGTSTNGAAAFGASINIKSDNISTEPYAELDNSFGSFNTLRNTLRIGTGLINNRLAMDARLSSIRSDGYVDRANAKLQSLFLSGSWIGKKSLLKATVFSGQERTYQAWYGVPQAKLSGNPDSLLAHFYNNYYPGGLYQSADDSVNLFDSDNRTYNYYRYKNEVDQYRQDHYQLHFNHSFANFFQLNAAAHYTRGRGYYEQFRQNEDFSIYGLDTLFIGQDTVTQTDIIRRRWLDNHFYGGLFSILFQPCRHFNLTAGGGYNRYDGDHFGEVMWAAFASQSQIEDRYYENNALKNEWNGFLKAFTAVKKWSFYADLQLRRIGYSYLGLDQSFGQLVPLEQSVAFTFFNPKAGIKYDLNARSHFYASYAVGNREPVRDDFIQSSQNSRPKAENLQNLETGFRFNSSKAFVNATGYLMYYRNQLILTGEINDVGAYNRTNVDRSYRAGIELEGGYKITQELSISGNATFSSNKIVSFTEYIDNYDNYDANGNMIQTIVEHENTDIAFSPNWIAAGTIQYNPIKKLVISLTTKYVGEQYLDNTSNDHRKLDDYWLLNAQTSYAFSLGSIRELRIGLQINNLLNRMYTNNGYTWGYIYGGQRITENYLFPQAGIHFMGRISIHL